MTVYIETGYDGKERKFVYGNGYYTKIYKQYKKSLNAWIEQFTKLLTKAKYNQEHLGIFDSVEEAELAHEEAKRKAIKAVAEEYKLYIPDKVYKALLAW